MLKQLLVLLISKPNIDKLDGKHLQLQETIHLLFSFGKVLTFGRSQSQLLSGEIL